MTLNRILRLFTIVIGSTLLFQSCASGGYSFTGGGPDYSTISSLNVSNFYSKVASGPADLPLRFTEDLKEFMQQRTKLEITNKQADTQLEGYISYYDVQPIGASNTNGQEFAALNRLVIRITVKYTNFIEPSQNFTREFSSPNDLTYEQNVSLSDVEDDLIDVAFDQIKLDIYNRCYSDW